MRRRIGYTFSNLCMSAGEPHGLLLDAASVSKVFSSYFPAPLYTVDIISAILRLGRKYQMDDLREEAVEILAHAFFRDHRTLFEGQSRLHGFKVYPGIIVDLANLAEQEELTFILPALLTFLAVDRFDSFDQAMNGTPRDDGSTIILSVTLLRRLVEAREAITQDFARKRLAWMWTSCLRGANRLPIPCSSPSGQAACAHNRHTFALALFPLIAGHQLMQYALDKGHFRAVSVSLDSMCITCREEGTRVYEQVRLDMLDKLPVYCGFPTWEKLRDAASTASQVRSVMPTLYPCPLILFLVKLYGWHP